MRVHSPTVMVAAVFTLLPLNPGAAFEKAG